MIMEENKINRPKIIDLQIITKKLWKNRSIFYKALPLVFVLSCIYIVSLPRYYNTDAKLAPEMGNGMNGGTLGTIASAFGFDFGDMQTTDAITPLLYPDLMEDNAYATKLFSILVEDKEGEIRTTYYDYLKKHQKKPWWGGATEWLRNLVKPKEEMNGNSQFDPYKLNKKDNDIVEKIRKNIKLSVDKKTGVITINIQDQDPKICKTLADSVMGNLQDFITEYRTNKARTDYNYYKKLAADAKQDYEKVRRYYASMADASTNIRLRSAELRMEDVENDMQLKLNTYQTLNTQLQAASAKVQDRTPVFTILKGAAIPIKPAGPKRMLFVIGMMFLSSVIISVYIYFKKENASI